MTTGRRPTLTDVAEEAGVSLKTASRAINGVPSVAPHLTERVNAAAERLGYRHNRMAAMLRSGRADMVGMIIRDMGNPFYAKLAAGAADVAEEHDSLLFVASSEADPARERKLFEEMVDRRVDGILLTPANAVNPPLVTEAAQGRTPVVALDVAPPGIDVDLVGFDNHDATREAVLAAVEAGCRRFAMILDSYELRTMEQRAAGAREALEQAGLGVDHEMVVSGQHTSDEASRVAARLLDLPHPPDAIFCANNIAAVGAASLVRQRNASTALISFDDFPLSRTLPTRVFVIDHDTRAMGATAARLLFERAADPTRPVQHVTVPTRLDHHDPRPAAHAAPTGTR